MKQFIKQFFRDFLSVLPHTVAFALIVTGLLYIASQCDAACHAYAEAAWGSPW